MKDKSYTLKGINKINVQILDFYRCLDTFSDEENIDFDQDTYCEEYLNENNGKLPMLIKIFGVLKSGHTITINIKNFIPYFYIKLPEDIKQNECSALMNEVKKLVFYKHRDLLLKQNIVMRKPFTEYTGNDMFPFLKLYFKNHDAYISYSKVFSSKSIKFKNNSYKFALFESNIDPIIKMIHSTEIESAGIVEISNFEIIPQSIRSTTTDFEVMITESGIKLCKEVERYPINVCAFDIEAGSSHGDFPIAIKNYQKLSQDLITFYSEQKKYKHPLTKKDMLLNVVISLVSRAFNYYYNNDSIHSIVQYGNEKYNDKITSFIRKYTDELSNSIYKIYNEYYKNDIFFKNILIKLLETNNDNKEVLTKIGIKEIDDIHKLNINTCKHYLISHMINHINVQEEIKNERMNTERKNILDFILNENEGFPIKLLSEILIKISSLEYEKNSIYLKNHIKCISQMLDMALDPYNDGFNISKLYVKFRSDTDINKGIPQIDKIRNACMEMIKYLEGGEIFLRTKRSPPTIIPPSNGEKINIEYFTNKMNEIFNIHFPPLEGDIVTQIGTTFQIVGETDCYLKHIICLDTCKSITNEELIDDENGDVYLPTDDLAKELVQIDISNGKYKKLYGDDYDVNKNKKSLIMKKKEEIATWDIGYRRKMSQLTMEVRKKIQLSTDKSEVIVETYATEKEVLLAWTALINRTDPDVVLGYNTFGFDYDFMYKRSLENGCDDQFMLLSRLKNYKSKLIEYNLSSSAMGENKLYYINLDGRINIDLFKVIQIGHKLDAYGLNSVCNKFLYKEKVDLPPSELFILQRGSDEDRKRICRYCIIDCILCNRLFNKLDILSISQAMASVCKVPMPYIFIRGQGAKLSSFVNYYCNKEKYLMPVLPSNDSDESYEGAIVLPPKKGIYFEPIVTLDFNSLYPSSIISENVSIDSFVQIGGKYDNLDEKGIPYSDITYDTYTYKNKVNSRGGLCKKKIKTLTGTNTCRYVQPHIDGKKAIVPSILEILLSERKNTRKRMKTITDPFQLKVLDGQQLAYKTVANSLYGQLGAKTGKFCKMEAAASTTAIGRNMIMFTKSYVERDYKDKIMTLTTEQTLDDDDKCTPYAGRSVHVKNSTCVYGDTDSVFIKFGLYDPVTNEKITGMDAIFLSMAIGKIVAGEVSAQLKRPQNLDFEKVICPFILISKKRYSGFYYTKMNNPYHYLNSMGIVLKRRDNAPIVKHVFGGAVKLIMEDQDVMGAMKFVKDECTKILMGEFPIDNFIISKTLKSYYKMPDKIAHNVLAKRQEIRDPGNKFSPNDRVPYCYIKVNGEGINVTRDKNKGKFKMEEILQGNYIETPQFIKNNNLEIDYEFYITNQIQKPVSQIFALEKGFDNIDDIFKKIITNVRNIKAGAKPVKFVINENAPKIVYRTLKKYIPEDDETYSSSEDEYNDDDETEDKIDLMDPDNVYNNFDNPLF